MSETKSLCSDKAISSNTPDYIKALSEPLDTKIVDSEKRTRVMTTKAKSNVADQLEKARNVAFKNLASKFEIQISDNDLVSLQIVKEELCSSFHVLREYHRRYQQYLEPDGQDTDTEEWYRPILLKFKSHINKLDQEIERLKVTNQTLDENIVLSSLVERNIHLEASHTSHMDDNVSELNYSIKSGISATSVDSQKADLEAKRASLLIESSSHNDRHKLELQKLDIQNRIRQSEINEELERTNVMIKACDEQLAILGQSPCIQSEVPLCPTAKPYVPKMHITPPQKTSVTNSIVPDYNDRNRSSIPEVTLVSILQQQTQLAEQLALNQQRSNLPTAHIEKFSGKEPLKYDIFIRSFKFTIEDKLSDKTEILYQLINHCTDEAKLLIRNCTSYDTINGAGYGLAYAKKLLAERYGDPCLQALEYKRVLESWEVVPSGDRIKLEKFANFLTDCVHAMSQHPSTFDVDGTTFVQSLVKKLNVNYQEKWKVNVSKLRNLPLPRLAKFRDLQEFVVKLSREQNDPQTCELGYQKKLDTKKSHETRSNRVFSTTINKPEQVDSTTTNINCIFCKRNYHDISKCFKFQNLDLKARSEFVKAEKLCFGCLKTGHQKADCNSKLTCEKCKNSHPTVFHREPAAEATTQINSLCAQLCEEAVHVQASTSNNVSMAIVPIKLRIKGRQNYVETYAFIDNGCSSCFVTSELKDMMGLKGKSRKVMINTMHSSKVVNTHRITDCLEVTGLDVENSWDDCVQISDCLTCNEIPVSVADAPKKNEIEQFEYLCDLTIAELDPNCSLPGVHMMIGICSPRASEPLKSIHSKGNGPYATLTRLGWMVYGLNGKPHQQEIVRANLCITNSDEDSLMLLEKLYNIDFPEKFANNKQEFSKEDNQFLKAMKEAITVESNHYVLPLPFKYEKPIMEDNRAQAERLLKGLKRRMVKDQNLKEKYIMAIKDMHENGFSETVPMKDISDYGRVWYIPHHPVLHPRKPDKVRPVFNCPIEYNESTLTETLMQGPNLTNSIVGVLCRFRMERIAFMADIKQMFNQVKVQKEDRDYLRFLWFKNDDLNENYEIRRMTTHLFGSNSSPAVANFALQFLTEEFSDEISEEVKYTILKNFYVDDLLKSMSNSGEAIKMVHCLINLLARREFHLCQWTSNSKELLETIPEEKRSKQLASLDLSHDAIPTENTLGMLWDPETDMFKFHIQPCNSVCTRRNILSVICRLYDPLGLAAPVTLVPKIIFQEACRRKFSWDQPIDKDLEERWARWLEEFPQLANYSLPRCLKPSNFKEPTNVELHHFSDASELGYGVASYVRTVDSDGHVHCTLLTGKSRVAPLKRFSIVQLELTAAKLAAEQDAILTREIKFQNLHSYFWTDSQTVLKYIANETARYKTFVANRVSIICSISTVSQWNFISGQENPADLATRGLSIDKFISCELWRNGPPFLQNSKSDWPNSLETCLEIDDNDTNLKKPLKINAIQTVSPYGVNRLFHYYSSWRSLKRAVIIFLRLKKILKDRILKNNQLKLSNSDDSESCIYNQSFTVSEYKYAQRQIILFIQKETFGEEINTLKNKKMLHHDCPLLSLNPYLDSSDDLLKLGGRLENAVNQNIVKNQIILPKEHHVTKLILEHCHRVTGHSGRNYTLSKLREKFWVINANSLARSVLKQCVFCRKQHAFTGQQVMADLPLSRVQVDDSPFMYCGVDYFGPFEVKRGRSFEKRYGCLFTCLNSRAVHLEVAHSMDTDSHINALRRFISRRGNPVEIHSDNGSNLVGAKNELQKIMNCWDLEKIKDFASTNNITWTFNPPTASHFGGVWERLIRSTRKVIQSILQEQYLKTCQNDETLQTLFCEVEAILNDRPLTKSAEDPEDLSIITPNSLLRLQAKPSIFPGPFVQGDCYSHKRWRQVQYLTELFWKRWIKEYLPLLQTRQKWLSPHRNLQLNDIVLIADKDMNRNKWELAKVIEVFPDKSGHVRHVKLKTKSAVLERPIVKTVLILEAEKTH